MSYFRTALLLAGLTGLFLAVGFLIGGEAGMVVAFGLALAMNLFAYWNSDRMVLSMYGAREIDRATLPWFYDLVAELSRRAELPMPRVYVIDSEQPNAFATGRNPENAAVAASTGLLRMLSHEEVAGVMAHELAHVKNRDTLVMTVTATLAGAIGMLGNMAMFTGMGGNNENRHPLSMIMSFAVMILAPMAAMLVQMAISRSREYEADRLGALVAGQPMWLASALAKIDQAAHVVPNYAAERNPATAHLFIVNPLSGAGMDNLFSTHPSTENRIAALRQLAVEFGGSPSAGAPAASGRESSRGSVPSSGPRSSARRTPWG